MSSTHVPSPEATPPLQPAPMMPPPQRGNGLAVAGFVLGLLGLLGSWIPVVNFFAIALAVIGVILAAVGLAKSRTSGSGKGLAIAGLVLGVLAVVLAVVVNVAFIDAVDKAVDDATSSEVEGSTDGTADGSSRDKPAPAGSTVTGDDWSVTVNSVEVIEQDSYGDKAGVGKSLLQVNLTSVYNGADEQGEAPWLSVKYVSAEGETFDLTTNTSLFIPDGQIDMLTPVYEGGEVTGNLIIEVPTSNWEDGVLAVSPGLMSDDTFVELP